MDEIITLNNSISGRITYLHRNQINVEIINPYKGIESGIHIPYFSMGEGRNHFAEWGESKLEITEYGLKRAREILQEIYDACNYIENNIDSLQKECHMRWREVILKHEDEDSINQEIFNRDKKNMKAEWKSGAFDQYEYSVRMEMLHQRLNKYNKMISEAENVLADILELRGKIIGYDLVRQLIYKYNLNQAN